MKILIDNGHGSNTPGKCSPDRRLLEWEFNRDVASRLLALLKGKGMDALRIVTEDHDVPLATRSRVVNSYARQGPCLLVSIHADAAGCDSKWHTARGLSAHVDPAASRKARDLARWVVDMGRKAGLAGNRAVPTCGYWTAAKPRLHILHRTSCPAVLVECGFMDNKEDCAMLLSEQWRDKMAKAIAEAVEKCV